MYETKQIDLFEKAPRFMTEKEWCIYIRSLVEDERDYWYVKVKEGVDLEFVDEIERKYIKMRELRLIDKFLEGVNCAEIESKGKNTCVVDYIWTVVKGKYGFSGMSYGSLMRELNYFNGGEHTEEGLSTEDVIAWRSKYHRNVSIYAINPLYRLFVSKPAINKKEVITLCYMVKDNHCYPILNDEIVRKYSKHCKNPMDTELKYVDMSDNVYLEGVDLSFLGEGDLLLVDNVEEKFVELVNKDKYQPLYFDFDAQNRLECFVHHKGYMVSKKVDYEAKKEICSKDGRAYRAV